MLEKNYSLHFNDHKCTIFDPFGEQLFCVKMKNKSFAFGWEKVFEHAYSSTTQVVSNLWHKRFGNFNQKSLSDMKQKEMVENMPVVVGEIQICETCQLGKQSRLPFPKGQAWRASQKLQLIHTDVCGPMQTASLCGNRYFILFIDDYTRMCWVYFIKLKSEVFTVFQRFNALVENQSSLLIKCLRSDNGTEYTSNQFVEYCNSAGIVHQFTTPYTPQQNGVCERKNRTVMEMARCLLLEKKIPNKLWAETVNTFVYFLNKLPTKALENKTPYEVWNGVKPAVDHLRVFGSICYFQIYEPKQSKLDNKAHKGILVGYGIATKGYRILRLQIGKVILSRNVKFDEVATWDWENQENVRSDSPFDVQSQLKADDLVVDPPVRGTRTLEDIYQKCNTAIIEATSHAEAQDSLAWRRAMEAEMEMINKNKTQQLVESPKDRKVIGVKWVFKTKLNPDGSICKHKARLVMKGYAQQYGVDYQETFAPVARYDTIRLLIALAASNSWQIHQLDVKSAFLNGFLAEEIFVEQPDGYVVQGKEDHVYLLQKALYGLKQAPRGWYDKMDLMQLGFNRSQNEATLYVKSCGNHLLIVSIYVDDMLITGSQL